MPKNINIMNTKSTLTREKSMLTGRGVALIFVCCLLVGLLAAPHVMAQKSRAQDAAASNDLSQQSIYDFKVSALDGSIIDFSQFRGKKILIVNTTSLAANHPQYAELEALQQKYKDRLVVVGFLAVDFFKTPDTKDFSPRDRGEYKVTFPLTTQVRLRGPSICPVYRWLTDVKYNKYKSTEIKYDFQKYLINEKGELVAEFDPKIRVTNSQVIQAIEK